MNTDVEPKASALCRLCANKIEHTPIYLFSPLTSFSPAQIIQQHFGIRVKAGCIESAYVCQQCWGTTEQFHHLYTTVQQNESNSLLLTCSNEKEPLPALGLAPAPSLPSDVKSEHVHATDLATLPTPVAPLTTPTALNAPFTQPCPDEQEVNLLKIEVSDDENDNAFDAQNESQHFSSSSSSSSVESRRFQNKRTGPSKHTVPINNKSKPSAVPVVARKAIRRHTGAELDEQNIRIRDYFQMYCDLCEARFEHLREAIAHYRRVHSMPGYLKCCGKKFFKRTLVMDHIQHHSDPNAFRCTSCDRSYISQAALNLHLVSHDAKLPKPYKCAVCSMEFVKYFQMTQHQRQKHFVSTIKSFGCDLCGKFFHTKWQMSTHIHSVHISSHICDTCAAKFKSKYHLSMHHQRVHSGETKQKVQCSQCAAWLSDEHSLRKHQKRHTQAAVMCKICGKMTSNPNALNCHIRNVHGERAYACTICDKTFIRAISLREHVAAHTGVDLYTCSYCPRTFKSSANMFAHRKKNHFIEWTRDRELRNNS